MSNFSGSKGLIKSKFERSMFYKFTGKLHLCIDNVSECNTCIDNTNASVIMNQNIKLFLVLYVCILLFFIVNQILAYVKKHCLRVSSIILQTVMKNRNNML